ncbi:hypothetical protein LXA43DRAFT_438133 [Ganoderma leucocontextum]|nr:hypothetical protein LXA43DRAFT_438133 [Ganoderma leucocontextum]
MTSLIYCSSTVLSQHQRRLLETESSSLPGTTPHSPPDVKATASSGHSVCRKTASAENLRVYRGQWFLVPVCPYQGFHQGRALRRSTLTSRSRRLTTSIVLSIPLDKLGTRTSARPSRSPTGAVHGAFQTPVVPASLSRRGCAGGGRLRLSVQSRTSVHAASVCATSLGAAPCQCRVQSGVNARTRPSIQALGLSPVPTYPSALTSSSTPGSAGRRRCSAGLRLSRLCSTGHDSSFGFTLPIGAVVEHRRLHGRLVFVNSQLGST